VATNTPGKPDGAYTVSGGLVNADNKLSVQLDTETGDITITCNAAEFSPLSAVARTEELMTAPVTEPIEAIEPDAQGIVEDLQELGKGISSGSLPVASDDPIGIILPEPGEVGNNNPHRVRIPVTIIPR
jgi:hypothetical protein